MKFLLCLLLLFNLIYGQDSSKFQYNSHAINLGYGKPINISEDDPHNLRGQVKILKTLSYGVNFDRSLFQFTYHNVDERLLGKYSYLGSIFDYYVSQYGHNYENIGFNIGFFIMYQDKKYHSFGPAAELRIGKISRYYLAVHIYSEKSYPTNSLKFHYKFAGQDNVLSMGVSKLGSERKDWYICAAIRKSVLQQFKVHLEGYHNFDENVQYLFVGLGYTFSL